MAEAEVGAGGPGPGQSPSHCPTRADLSGDEQSGQARISRTRGGEAAARGAHGHSVAGLGPRSCSPGGLSPGWMSGWVCGQMDGWKDGQADGRNEWMTGWPNCRFPANARLPSSRPLRGRFRTLPAPCTRWVRAQGSGARDTPLLTPTESHSWVHPPQPSLKAGRSLPTILPCPPLSSGSTDTPTDHNRLQPGARLGDR